MEWLYFLITSFILGELSYFIFILIDSAEKQDLSFYKIIGLIFGVIISSPIFRWIFHPNFDWGEYFKAMGEFPAGSGYATGELVFYALMAIVLVMILFKLNIKIGEKILMMKKEWKQQE